MEKDQNESGQMENTKIDWEQLKRKVEVAEETLSKGESLSTENINRILKSRAQKLAPEEKDNTTDLEFVEIIEFSLGPETYALETEFVREVYLLNNFTPLPGLPDFVIGIINVRGQILSILDLKKLFNLPFSGIGELNKIIFIKNENMEFGVLADVINGTYSIPLNTIQTSYTDMPGIGAEYLKGVTSENVIVLDAKSLLEDEKITINQKTE